MTRGRTPRSAGGEFAASASRGPEEGPRGRAGGRGETARPTQEEAVANNTFCTLATSSADNRPHVAGALYALVGHDL